MLHDLRPLLPFLGSLLLAAAPEAAQVHVVDEDGGPGADFTQIAAAVAAAASGDTILVRGGGYEPFEVVAKSLSIVEEKGHNARVGGTVTVRGLLPGQRVLLRGLRTSEILDAPGLHVVDCAGTVWVEDCRWLAEDGEGTVYSATPGVEVEASGRVVLVRVTSDGSPPSSSSLGFGRSGGDGARATASRLSVWGGSYVGKNGTGGDELGGNGGDGIHLADSSAWVAGARLVAGDGGWADSDIDIFGSGEIICNPPGTGGDGIQAWSTFGLPPGVVRTLDNVYNPGLAGFNQEPGCPSSTAGVPVHVSFGPGEWLDLAGQAKSLVVSSPARPGELVDVHAEGSEGELAVAVFAASELDLFLPQANAVLQLLPPLVLVPLGALPAGGELTLQAPAPGLPPAQGAITLFGQGLFLDGASAQLGAPTSLVVVDAPL